MRIDVGKMAKTKGSVRPRDARRSDHEPSKARKAVKKPRTLKSFGISYESKDLCFLEDGKLANEWRPHEFWYDTQERRDQALKAFRHRYRDDLWYRNHQPIDRAASKACDSAGGARE